MDSIEDAAKPAPPKAKKKVKRPTKSKAKKHKAAKSKKKTARKPKSRATVVRSERLDMRLSRAEKSRIIARANKLRRTVTSLVIEAIEKIR